MRLKSLEIKGFKSFANQTVINFNEDVIGIVGPNGSGKSNIVDAIRWVLGEQSSKELRLDQMLSVIFNGTKKRKAAGLAQVSLTFENTRNLLPTEYSAITVSRLLYRTGESEYRLNGVPCRLKDITSLFLDTGIGSNSYAIIALGMVDDILEDKEDSRRKMFEQAAGVAKYKLRKRETLAKLKSTADDLERIEDLLHEIGGNLRALEKQARRTKKYFELREEYKKLSIELALLKVSTLKGAHKELNAQIEREQDLFRAWMSRPGNWKLAWRKGGNFTWTGKKTFPNTSGNSMPWLGRSVLWKTTAGCWTKNGNSSSNRKPDCAWKWKPPAAGCFNWKKRLTNTGARSIWRNASKPAWNWSWKPQKRNLPRFGKTTAP